MNPFRRMWLKLWGQPVPDPFQEIHRESAELTHVARTLRNQLESYQNAHDPFMAMIEDVWNRRQMLLNGGGHISKN